MKTNELTQEKFPVIFGYGRNILLKNCRDFLEGKMSRTEFENFVVQINNEFKKEDETLDQLYRSGGMGRPGIMDGAPQVASDFRLEIIQILDGEKPKWEW